MLVTIIFFTITFFTITVFFTIIVSFYNSNLFAKIFFTIIASSHRDRADCHGGESYSWLRAKCNANVAERLLSICIQIVIWLFAKIPLFKMFDPLQRNIVDQGSFVGWSGWPVHWPGQLVTDGWSGWSVRHWSNRSTISDQLITHLIWQWDRVKTIYI